MTMLADVPVRCGSTMGTEMLVTRQQDVTEIVTTIATLARVRAKLRAASDEASRRYFELCLAGWEKWLKKLKENANEVDLDAR